MTRIAWIGGVLAVAALAAGLALWWAGGAWQYGDMPTRGAVRTAGFASASVICHWIAARLRWRR
jgi:nitrogen fixation-related uncharacterized protein